MRRISHSINLYSSRPNFFTRYRPSTLDCGYAAEIGVYTGTCSYSLNTGRFVPHECIMSLQIPQTTIYSFKARNCMMHEGIRHSTIPFLESSFFQEGRRRNRNKAASPHLGLKQFAASTGAQAQIRLTVSIPKSVFPSQKKTLTQNLKLLRC